MTANMIRSYVWTDLFTDDELQLDEASYSNRHIQELHHEPNGKITEFALFSYRRTSR